MGPLLAAWLALALAAQEPPPVQRFTSSIDVVQVDVSAVDGRGQPIRDLTATDFDLRVDGRPRPIVSAQFVSVAASAGAPAAPAPAHYTSNTNAGGGRLIMVVVDRTSIATGRGRAAIEAASRFVGGLNPADRVALATIPQGPQVNFTADHELVQRLLRKIDGTAVTNIGTRNIGIADALAFERRDDRVIDDIVERECGRPGGRGSGGSDVKICADQVRSEANVVAAEARQRARSSIHGLHALVENLPPSKTPKMLVFISEGLVVEREAAQLAWLEARAAEKHVTIYPLHLESSQFDAAQARAPVRPSADRAIQEQGLAVIAQATRGDMFRILGNSDFAFQRLANELSGYYLLGFEPAQGDRNGKPHDISVDVKRPGVTVRARRQFTIGPTVVRTADAEIVAALRDPLPATEIPITVTTYTFRDPHHDKLRVLVAAEIDRAINRDGRISVGYVLVDFDGRLAASQMDMALPAEIANGSSVQRYFSNASTDPGKYTLKLAVVDDAGRRGSVERVVDARLAEAGPIRATDLLIADSANRTANLPLAPAVTGDIAGGKLHGYLELFADTPETLERASITLEITGADSPAAMERVPVQLRTTPENSRCRIAGAGVDIARLPPGNYVAHAVITVGLQTVGEITRPFRIVNR